MKQKKRRIVRPSEDLGYVVQWGDTHYPHIDQRAEDAVLQFSRDWQPDTHLWIGDCLDLASISRFSTRSFMTQYQDPVIDSIRGFGQAINRVRKINPNSRLVWIFGNHDERLESFVEEYPAWRGIADDVRGLIRQFGRCDAIDDVEIIKLKDIDDDFSIGKMHYHHGTKANIHCAASMVAEWEACITFGHTHTQQVFTKTTRGKFRQAYCIGHLSNRNARGYVKGNSLRWVTGFAFMEHDKKTEQFTQHVIPIVNGGFRYAGKTYQGKGTPTGE